MNKTAVPTNDEIRKRAHQLWEMAGRPEKREQEFWHRAEQELKEEYEEDEDGDAA